MSPTSGTATFVSPSSVRTRFTCRFLRALKALNNSVPGSTSISSSVGEIYRRRFNRVKAAANASMACAVGSRRAWSRAVLWEIRNRSSWNRRGRANLVKRRRSGVRPKKKRNPNRDGEFDELRKIVPGGGTMEVGSLLEETADYIKCLNTQVQVMKGILDLCSTS